MRLFRFCLYLLIAFLFVDSVQCQSPVATMQPFGSFGGGPDAINLGSLNSHITIPIRHKAGRGTDFDLTLTYDSSVWTPLISGSTKSWQPVASSTVPGWQGLNAAGQSFFSYSMTYSGPWRITCDGYNYYNYETWTYSGFYYIDVNGAAHNYPNIYYSYTDYQGHPYPGCGPALGFSPSGNTQSSLAPDGSGFTIYVTPNCCGSTPNVYIVDKNGTKINAPILSKAPSTCMSVVDRNGNEITCSNGTYTDTLGQTAVAIIGTAPSNTTLSYAAPSETATFTVKYTAYTVQTKFGCTNPAVSEYGPTSLNLVSEIDLPDGSKYLFDYEKTPNDTHTPYYRTGRISSITLPTGGTITYTYTNGNFTSGASGGIVCVDGSAAGIIRTVSPGGPWTYARGGTVPSYTTTITDPLNQQTVLQFETDGGGIGGSMFETQRKVYDASSSLLQTVSTCYNNNTSCTPTSAVSSPISQRNVTSQFGTSGLKTLQVYYYDTYGNATKEIDYDYASGTPSTILRTIVTNYQSFTNTYTGPFEEPLKTTICNGTGTSTICGTGTVVAQTTYGFTDSVTASPSGTTQHVSVSSGRGNVGSVSYLVAGSTTLNKSFTYWDTGVVNIATDVNNAVTTYTFQNANSSCGNSFPTKVSEPLNLSRSFTWNCTGGVLTQTTDENNKTTTTTYNDPYFWRINGVTDPMNNAVGYYYQPNASDSTPFAVYPYMIFNNGNSIIGDLKYLDGLGRPFVDQLPQSPGSSTFDTVSYTFDSIGRLYSVSMPCSVSWTVSCSTPQTTQTYDALNRPLVTTDGGGGTTTYNYSQNDVLVTVSAPTGEHAKQRQLENDALGRLTSVCEITSASGSGNCGQTNSKTGYWTKYTYNPLGQITGVTQNAQNTNTAYQQTRNFVYDLLGRMTSETNPESGTTTYTYDSDASCGASAGDLMKRVTAAGYMTCYGRDALHRVTTEIMYNNPNEQGNKYFVYDTATVNGQQMQNGLGRLVEAYTAGTPTGTKLTDVGFSYTVRGEVSDIYQSTAHSGSYYHMTESYFANGVPNVLGNNISGLPAFTYSVDPEGRPSTVSSSTGANPVTATTFNYGSQPTGVTLGSGDSDAFSYDPNTGRQTQYQFNVGAQSVKGTLTWNANSTLQQLLISDPFNSTDNQTCNYVYDDLIRLSSANCSSAMSDSYSYDTFGNASKSGTFNLTALYTSATGQNTNRYISIAGTNVSYDANGNVLNDTSHQYTWNTAGRPVTIDSVGVTYDALDRPVEQNRSGAYTQIVYAPTGEKVALMSGSTLQKAFVPLPGGGQAIYTLSGLIYYRHADWLGSSRFASTPSRTMYSDTAYAPFGEPYAQAGSTDLSYTGQNQDLVAGGLAGPYDFTAREYSPQGRWVSPDPSGLAAVDPTNPQSWNRYAYVLNNPLAYVDPLGLEWDCVTYGGVTTCQWYPDPPGTTNVPNGCVAYGTEGCITGPPPPVTIGGGPGSGGSTGSGNSSGGPNNQNVAKSVTSQCLAEYNGSTAAKGVQFFSLYHLATDLRNAWAEWTLLPAGKYALAKTASWISGQIGTTEFLSVTGATSTVIPSTTGAVVDLAETAGKAGAAPAIVAGTGLDVLANAGCATVGRQAAGQMTPLPPGWASTF